MVKKKKWEKSFLSTYTLGEGWQRVVREKRWKAFASPTSLSHWGRTLGYIYSLEAQFLRRKSCWWWWCLHILMTHPAQVIERERERTVCTIRMLRCCLTFWKDERSLLWLSERSFHALKIGNCLQSCLFLRKILFIVSVSVRAWWSFVRVKMCHVGLCVQDVWSHQDHECLIKLVKANCIRPLWVVSFDEDEHAVFVWMWLLMLMTWIAFNLLLSSHCPYPHKIKDVYCQCTVMMRIIYEFTWITPCCCYCLS